MRRTSETGVLVRAPRMRTLRGPSRTLKSLHRTVSTSDVPFVTLRHARVGFRYPPDALSYRRRVTLRSVCRGGVDLRARGPCVALAVRPRRAKARERLPSYRESTSRDPQTARGATCLEAPRTHTVSPSTHPRPASGGATDFLPASVLAHQQALRPPGEEDARCVQPTSATQSNCVHPHLVCSQILTPLSQRGRPTESKAPYGISGEPDVSRRPRTLRRIDRQRGTSRPLAGWRWVVSVGVVFPRRCGGPYL